MFKSPIEWLKELIQELVEDFANMAFDWLDLFMLKPTDFSKYDKVSILYDFVFTLAVSLSIVFVAWALISIMLNNLGGVESRSIPEVLTKALTGGVLAASTPWLIDNVLLKLNNGIVQFFLDKGLDTKTLEDFAVLPLTAPIAFFAMALVIAVLFVLLGLQYIQRIGEFIVLMAVSPIAAYSVITESYEIWSVWWREIISVIFTQAFQVSFLWLVLNLITGTEKLSDYMLAIGLMVVLLKGPKIIRQFLYSTGAGRSAVSMAGGTAKMTIYKYAANKVTRR